MFHWFRKHTDKGLEVPDTTPDEVTLSGQLPRPLTIQEQILRFTNAADFQKAIAAKGMDTFEEAEDLEVVNDDEPQFGPTAYELRDQEPFPGLQTRQDEIRGGQVQELPEDRLNRAREALKPKVKDEKKEEKPVA